tara:strand:- start:8504 stop:8707 length:204 start_codon:yes stop_codon:yes gene_type:complete
MGQITHGISAGKKLLPGLVLRIMTQVVWGLIISSTGVVLRMVCVAHIINLIVLKWETGTAPYLRLLT